MPGAIATLSLRINKASRETFIVQAITPPMNIRSVEGWYIIFQTLSVIFVMLTVGAGAGTIITGYVANRRQTKSIADANTKASEAGQEVAKLQISVVEAEQKRVEAERALLELQERLAPRVITLEQRQRFLFLMEPLPKGKVEIRFMADNKESTQFASALAEMFAESGCEVIKPLLPFIPPGNAVFGIGLRIKDEHAVPPHSVSLQKTLERIGIETPAQVESANLPMEADLVRVYVYGKK
jgi:hypothetical protein